MNGYQYEEKCAELLRGRGFINVDVTPGSGDQGVDIIAEKDGIKWAVQCKYYEGTVGNKAVQEVFAGACFYDCDKALIITNSKLTNPAQILADKLKVEVWDDINAIVLQQEASSLNADRVYVDDEQAVSAIEAYLKGEAYEQFLREYPPNDALNQEIEAFVNDISARIEKMHNELVQSANDPSKAEIIEAYFENRNDFIDLTHEIAERPTFKKELINYRDWNITEELRNNFNNTLFYPFEIDVLSGFSHYVADDNRHLEWKEEKKKEKMDFYEKYHLGNTDDEISQWIKFNCEDDGRKDLNKKLNEAEARYNQQIDSIIDKALVEKLKAELDSIEVLIFQYIERGENDGASYTAMNSLVALLEQLYCCGVVSVTTTSANLYIYYYNSQPYFDDNQIPFWREYNPKYDFLRIEKPIDLACQGRKLVAEVARDHVPTEPFIKVHADESVRLMLLNDKYKENKVILEGFQEKIDFYSGKGWELLNNIKQELTLTEKEFEDKSDAIKELTNNIVNKTKMLEDLEAKLKEATHQKAMLEIKQSNKIIRSYVLNQKISDAINYLESLKKQFISEYKNLKQLEEEEKGIERIIEQCKDKIQDYKVRIENLEIDLLTSEYKVSLNQAEYDKQKKVLDEIQEAINNNHRDFLFENYGDIIYGMRK